MIGRAKNQLPEVRKSVLSFDGYPFQQTAPVWRLNRNTTIPVASINGLMSTFTTDGFLRTLEFFARNSSSSHTSNLFQRYLALLKFSPGDAVTPSLIARYRQSLQPSQDWYLGCIRVFVKQWSSLGYGGLDKDLVDFFEELTIKANRKGEAVKQLDSDKGPLSDIELVALNDLMVQTYEVGGMSITDLAISMLASATGSRGIQLTSLRLVDLISLPNKDGDLLYFVAMPRGKQTGASFRATFRKRPVTDELWLILMAQKEHVLAMARSIWGFEVSEELLNELPMFPRWSEIHEIRSVEALNAVVSTDRLHLPSKWTYPMLKRVVATVGVVSERTGQPLKLSMRRFRYTIGTRAAREGYGPLVIAELLDHVDTQNVSVYSQNVPEHAAKIDAAVGHQLARYAQAFAGVLVDSHTQALRGEEPESLVRSQDGVGTGTCGNYGFCNANVPIPCYTCMHFQPWVDGPHQAVYTHLLIEREKIIASTGDLTIAAVLDRSILAVAEVVQACEKRKLKPKS